MRVITYALMESKEKLFQNIPVTSSYLDHWNICVLRNATFALNIQSLTVEMGPRFVPLSSLI